MEKVWSPTEKLVRCQLLVLIVGLTSVTGVVNACELATGVAVVVTASDTFCWLVAVVLVLVEVVAALACNKLAGSVTPAGALGMAVEPKLLVD